MKRKLANYNISFAVYFLLLSAKADAWLARPSSSNFYLIF